MSQFWIIKVESFKISNPDSMKVKKKSCWLLIELSRQFYSIQKLVVKLFVKYVTLC